MGMKHSSLSQSNTIVGYGNYCKIRGYILRAVIKETCSTTYLQLCRQIHDDQQIMSSSFLSQLQASQSLGRNSIFQYMKCNMPESIKCMEAQCTRGKHFTITSDHWFNKFVSSADSKDTSLPKTQERLYLYHIKMFQSLSNTASITVVGYYQDFLQEQVQRQMTLSGTSLFSK